MSPGQHRLSLVNFPPSGPIFCGPQYSLRERLVAANGTAANSVILLRAPPTGNLEAYTIAKIDEWLTNLAKDSSNSSVMNRITRAKPADLLDSCNTETGVRFTEPQTFYGGECNKLYPTFPSPRMMAGGPVMNNILKC